MAFVGLIDKSKNVTCKTSTIDKVKAAAVEECVEMHSLYKTQGGAQYTGSQWISELFTKECVGLQSCDLDTVDRYIEVLKEKCPELISTNYDAKAGNTIMAFADCGYKAKWETEQIVDWTQFNLAVVFLDLLCILAFIIFIKVLRARQLEYMEEYALQTIEVSDFTVVVELPEDLGNNEHLLRARLMDHFEQVLSDGREKQAHGDLSQSPLHRHPVATVSFGRQDNDSTWRLM